MFSPESLTTLGSALLHAMVFAFGAVIGGRRQARVFKALLKGTMDFVTGNGRVRLMSPAPDEVDEARIVPLFRDIL